MEQSFNGVASAIETISDEAERKRFRLSIATLMAERYAQLMIPILQRHPDLKPTRESDTTPDGSMTPEQETLAASLSPEFIQKIDDAILAQAKKHARKVAMIVGMTMMDETLRIPGLPDLFYAQRIKALVKEGRLLAKGNLDYMGYSEIKLP